MSSKGYILDACLNFINASDPTVKTYFVCASTFKKEDLKSVYIYLVAVAAVVELVAGELVVEVVAVEEDIAAAAAAGEFLPCFVVVVANLINSVNSETVTEDDSESHTFENT